MHQRDHPSSYAGLTRDGLVSAMLDRLIEADGRKPDGNNPADRLYLLNRLQDIVHVLQHPSTPRPDLACIPFATFRRYG